jgi:hypothetical protein
MSAPWCPRPVSASVRAALGLALEATGVLDGAAGVVGDEREDLRDLGRALSFGEAVVGVEHAQRSVHALERSGDAGREMEQPIEVVVCFGRLDEPAFAQRSGEQRGIESSFSARTWRSSGAWASRAARPA